jgi:hypothetical protein
MPDSNISCKKTRNTGKKPPPTCKKGRPNPGRPFSYLKKKKNLDYAPTTSVAGLRFKAQEASQNPPKITAE